MDTGTDNRSLIVREAERWLGTPFHHQAQIFGVGVGCGTLLIAVYGALGYRVPKVEDFDNFPLDWHHHAREERYLDILSQYAEPVADPKPGDIALFKMGRVYAHSAIVVDYPRVIHVYWGGKVEYADAGTPPLFRNPANHPIFLRPFPVK